MTFKDDELNWSRQPASTSHAEWHIYGDVRGGHDVVYIWTRALMPFRVSAQDVPDLTVKIEGPQVYLWALGWKEWLGDASVDLSGSVPGTGLHRYTLISIDGATSAAQITDGDTVADTLYINPGGWPVPPSGSIPVGLVHLSAGQTTITDEDDIVDGRIIVSSAGGSITPGAHHLIDGTVHDDADTYAAPSRGEIVRFGASAWERYDAKTLGAVLIGDGTDIVSDTSPEFVGLVGFDAGIYFDGASGVNLVKIPDGQGAALILQDGGPVEYLRIDTAPQLGIDFNNAGEDIDIYFRSVGVIAVFIQGSDGAVSLHGPSMDVNDNWWLGGSVANARIIFDFTPAPDQIILADADLNMGGANVVIPDAQADALHVIDDATAIEFQRFVTTAGSQATVFNIGEVDVDFRVAASGVTDALIVYGAAAVPDRLVIIRGQQGTAYGSLGLLNTRAVNPNIGCNEFDAAVNITGGSTTGCRAAYFGLAVSDAAATNYTQVLGFAGEVYLGLQYNDGAAANTTAWTGTATLAHGVEAACINISAGAGVVVHAKGAQATVRNVGATSIIRNAYGLYVSYIEATGADAGQTHNAFGLYIANLIAATGGGVANNAWAIYSIATEPSYLSGSLGIGATAPGGRLHVKAVDGGAIPVALLDQADQSEEFIEFTSAIGAAMPIDTATALGGYYGMARVSVTGVGFKWIPLYN